MISIRLFGSRFFRIAGITLCALPAYAADRGTPPIHVGAADPSAFAGDTAPDWRNIFVDTGRSLNYRPGLFGGLRESRQFGLFDNATYRGLHIPLAPSWRAVFDTSLNPAHYGLTQYTVGTQLKKVLPGAWTAGIGFRRNAYANSASHSRSFSLAHYWGRFAAEYTLSADKPGVGASALAQRAQVSYHYGKFDSSSVGLAYTTGRELESNTRAAGLYGTDVHYWTLSGRHWIARDWAVTYEALSQRRSGLSLGAGLRLGLGYRF